MIEEFFHPSNGNWLVINDNYSEQTASQLLSKALLINLHFEVVVRYLHPLVRLHETGPEQRPRPYCKPSELWMVGGLVRKGNMYTRAGW